VEWLPDVNITEVVGMLEVIHDNGDKMGADDLQRLTGIPFDELLPAIDAAVMLGLAVIRKHYISLTERGKKLLSLDPEERKEKLSEYIGELPVFKKLFKIILKKGGKISEEELLEMLKKEMSGKDAKSELKKIIQWGQYAEILDYDPPSKEISIL